MRNKLTVSFIVSLLIFGGNFSCAKTLESPASPQEQVTNDYVSTLVADQQKDPLPAVPFVEDEKKGQNNPAQKKAQQN